MCVARVKRVAGDTAVHCRERLRDAAAAAAAEAASLAVASVLAGSNVMLAPVAVTQLQSSCTSNSQYSVGVIATESRLYRRIGSQCHT